METQKAGPFSTQHLELEEVTKTILTQDAISYTFSSLRGE